MSDTPRVDAILAKAAATDRWILIDEMTALARSLESTPQPGMVTVPREPEDEAEFLLTQKMAEKLPWRNMDTVPKSESQPFLVIRRGIVLQVSNFEGRIYPDALEGVLDWDDGITDATGWLPIAALRSGEKGTP